MNRKYAGRSFVFDIETNGLLGAVTRVHCAVAVDIETLEVLDFKPHEIDEFLELYKSAKLLIGHNIIGYDCAVIQKLYGIPIPPAERLLDTVNLSRLVFPDIKALDLPKASAWKKYKAKRDAWERSHPDVPFSGVKVPDEFPGHLVGRHCLESWGFRMGHEKKGDYAKDCKAKGIDPWAEWNEDMHAYMIQDGRVNLELYRHLMSFEPSPQSVRLEMRVQRLCSQIERNGWVFDEKTAQKLYVTLSAERESLAQSLRSLFPPWKVQLPDFIPKRNNKTKGYVAGVPVERWETVEFNPASRDHIADRLRNKYNWEPTDYTLNGRPKIDDDVLTSLPYPEAQALARYFLIQKRIGQLAEGEQAWLRCVTKDGKIHGRYNTNGAATGRATHSSPNISQVPSSRAEFGKECRALFTVPAGWVQIGADQSGLELRCLGSYISAFDGGAYIQTVLYGDIHWENAKALFGLPDDTERYAGTDESGDPIEIKKHELMRGVAKTFIYAFLYGAGDHKLGETAGVTPEEIEEWRSDPTHRAGLMAIQRINLKRHGVQLPRKDLYLTYKGQLLRARFLEKFPALNSLIKFVKKAAKKKWLKGLDGRKLPVRSEHSALNTLLQSAGAVICKQWIADAEQALVDSGLKHGWDGDFAVLGWIHDELQVAVRAGLEEKVREILVNAAKRAGEPFPAWNCPTDGEAKAGRSWAECH